MYLMNFGSQNNVCGFVVRVSDVCLQERAVDEEVFDRVFVIDEAGVDKARQDLCASQLYIMILILTIK